MPGRHHSLTVSLGLAALLSLLATPVVAQTSAEQFRKVLRDEAALTAGDLTTLDQGQIVARLLPVKDKREIAVFGIVQLGVPDHVFLQFTRDNVAQQNNKAILQIGRFSNTPTIEDLQALTLENRDIEDLKRCTVGECNLKMSAAMIERIHNEVDWGAPDYAVQATLVFRQMLLDYVRDYLSRGSAALMAYSERSRVVSVDEEQRALLDAAIYFNQFAPEFTKYVRNFPRPELAGAENAIFWSKIKFGLKPVITLTHVIIYPRPANTAPQVLVASRQIYADHYFDSSLALSAFVKLPAVDQSYLLYTNRSRADALGGLFSGLKRTLVEGEAIDSLKNILQEQKLKMEIGAGPADVLPVGDGAAPGWTIWHQGRIVGWHLFWWVLLIFSLAALFWLVRRNSKRRGSRSC